MLKSFHVIVLALLMASCAAAGTKGIPGPAIPDGLGVTIHFYGDDDAQVKQIADAGFKFIRMDIFWFIVEKEKGVYDFSEYDGLMKALDRHGLRAMFIVSYGNKLYSGSENDKIAPADDNYRKAYAAYAGAAAAHFKGRGVLWEIWNEPNSEGFWQPKPKSADYVAMAKGASKAIRAADPDATILGPTTYGIDFGFLQETFKLGLLDAVDAVSVHPYGHWVPDVVVPTYDALRKVISDLGKTTPIISSEWGYSTVAMTEEMQAQWMTRMFLTDTLCGVPVSIWYDWHDDGTDPKDWQHHFGVVNYEFAPKPAYVAMQTLTKQLGGYKFVRRMKTARADEFLLVFGDGRSFRLAAWTSAEPHEIAIPLKVPAVVLTDMVGKRGKRAVEGGALKLGLNGSPSYIDSPYDRQALDLQ